MAQSYITQYSRSYRPFVDYRKRRIMNPGVDSFSESLPAGGNWLTSSSLVDGVPQLQEIDKAKTLVKELYRDRYWSTYQYDYCSDSNAAEDTDKDEVIESQLIHACRALESSGTQAILPPTASARRVFGYLRPSYFYIPKTTYQKIHGTIACEVLERDFKKRIEAERRKALETGEKKDGSKEKIDSRKSKDLTEKVVNAPLDTVNDNNEKVEEILKRPKKKLNNYEVQIRNNNRYMCLKTKKRDCLRYDKEEIQTKNEDIKKSMGKCSCKENVDKKRHQTNKNGIIPMKLGKVCKHKDR